MSKVMFLFSYLYVMLYLLLTFFPRLTVVEFNGSTTPQPFLDPSIMQKRAQLEREWKADQERNRRQQLEIGQAEASSRS